MQSARSPHRSFRSSIACLASRTSLLAVLALSVLGFSATTGCGSDEGKRGLQPSHEESTPASNPEDAMTEAERRKQQALDIQNDEIEDFDRAEGD